MKRLQKPQFINQKERRRLRARGLWPPKKEKERSPPSNIRSIAQTETKHRIVDIKFIDERKGTTDPSWDENDE